MKNVYRTAGLGALSWCRLFVVLFLGSFIWGSSLKAVNVTASNGAGVTITASVTRDGDDLLFTVTTSGFSESSPSTNVATGWAYYNDSAGGVYLGGNDFGGGINRNTTTNYTKNAPRSAGPYYFRVGVQSEFGSGTYIRSPVTLIDEPEGLSQTCSLSPNSGAASIVKGQTFSGQASGAQAGNPYNISIISGQGSASINSSTGAYTIIANGAGLITYKVWISAGGGYERSADAQASIAVGVSKQVKVTIPANKGAFVIEHKIVDAATGEMVPGTGVLTQVPGAGAYILTVDVPSGNNVVLLSRVIGAAKDDQGNWHVDDDAITDLEPSDPIEPKTPDDLSSPVPVVTPTDQSKPGATAGSKPGTKIVWSSGSGSMDPTQQVDLLTNATFKEGVQNIVDGLKPAPDASDDKEETSATMEKAKQAFQDAIDYSNEKAGVFSQVFLDKQLQAPAIPEISQSTGGSSVTAYRVIGVNGAATSFSFNLNPFNNSKVPSWLDDLMSLTRLILAVTAIGWLYVDVMRQSRVAIMGVLQVNREGEFLIEKKLAQAAQGIPFVGGLVGSAISLAGRVILFAMFAAVILAVPAVLVTIADLWGEIGYQSYRDELGLVLSSQGVMGVILSMAVGVVPIPTLVACFGSRMLAETLINSAVLPVAVWLKLFRM